MQTVGGQVRARLDALAMHQRDFARIIGMDESQLAKYLNGERPTPIEHAERWCTALSLTPDAAAELKLAIHLSFASPWLADTVARIRADLDGAHALLRFYEKHVATVGVLIQDLSAMRGLRAPPKAPAPPVQPTT